MSHEDNIDINQIYNITKPSLYIIWVSVLSLIIPSHRRVIMIEDEARRQEDRGSDVVGQEPTKESPTAPDLSVEGGDDTVAKESLDPKSVTPKKRTTRKRTPKTDVPESECKKVTLPELAAPQTTEEAKSETSSTEPDVPKPDTISIDDVKSGEHVESPDEELAGEEPQEIDMSKVEVDKDGIPILTSDDIRILKTSGMTVSDNWNLEVKSARDEIKRIDHETSDEYQDSVIKDMQDEIDRHKNNKELSDTDRERKIKICQDIIDAMPRFNAKTRRNYAELRKSSIMMIAAYQLVARKDVKEIVKSGALLALVSSSAIRAFRVEFLSLYGEVNEIEVSKENKDKIDEIEKSVREPAKKRGMIYGTLIQTFASIRQAIMSGSIDEEMKKSFRELIDTLITTIKSDKDYTLNETALNDIDMLERTKSFVFVSTLEVDQAITETENVLGELDNILNDSAQDIENIRWLDMADATERMQQEGIVPTMLRYADMLNGHRQTIMAHRRESMLTSQYFESLGTTFFHAICTFVRDSFDSEFNAIKANLNNVTIFPNNLLYALRGLKNNDLPAEWKKGYDSENNFLPMLSSAIESGECEGYFDAIKALDGLFDPNNATTRNFLISRMDNVAANMMEKNAPILRTMDKKVMSGAKARKTAEKQLQLSFSSSFIRIFSEILKSIMPDDGSERKQPDLGSLISMLTHNDIGGNLMKAFVHLNEVFNKNMGKDFGSDCLRYLVNEYILSQLMIIGCREDETPTEHIRRRTKELVHKSMSTFFTEKLDINIARQNLIKIVTELATKTIATVININDALGKEYDQKRVMEKTEQVEKTRPMTEGERRDAEARKRKAIKKAKRLEKQASEAVRQLIGYSTFASNPSKLTLSGWVIVDNRNAFHLTVKDDHVRIVFSTLNKLIQEHAEGLVRDLKPEEVIKHVDNIVASLCEFSVDTTHPYTRKTMTVPFNNTPMTKIYETISSKIPGFDSTTKVVTSFEVTSRDTLTLKSEAIGHKLTPMSYLVDFVCVDGTFSIKDVEIPKKPDPITPSETQKERPRMEHHHTDQSQKPYTGNRRHKRSFDDYYREMKYGSPYGTSSDLVPHEITDAPSKMGGILRDPRDIKRKNRR